MSASVVLASLPRDAHTALEMAGQMDVKKGISRQSPSSHRMTALEINTADLGNLVTVRFKAVGSAPILQQTVFKINATQRFETVVNFLRSRLKAKREDSVFCYVNSVFAPGLDEVVGNLWKVSFLLRVCVDSCSKGS
jgi:ubiquitin-like protein ATG12